MHWPSQGAFEYAYHRMRGRGARGGGPSGGFTFTVAMLCLFAILLLIVIHGG